MTQTNQTFTALAVPGVRALRPYQPGKPLNELAREYGVRDAVKLASNENPWGPSPAAVQAAQAAAAQVHRYPEGDSFALKQALAERHGVAPASITVGNGSNDILELIGRAFLQPGVNAVFSRHAFALYPLVTQACGATAKIAPPRPAADAMAYGDDLQQLAALVDADTRVVFIANPNNPTGTWVTHDALERFLQGVPPTVLVVVDEAYYEYAAGPDYPDTTAWLGRFPNLITCRTFSKAYGLAGLRIGYGVCVPELADLLNRVRQPFNVNLPAQAAALAALDDVEHITRSVTANRAGMEQLIEGLAALDLRCLPSAANFLCVDVGQPGVDVYQALLPEGVIVRPVANYGMPDHLRITIGRAEENSRCLAALRKVLGR